MRRVRQDHLCGTEIPYQMNGSKVTSGSAHPKAAPAGRLAKTSSAYNDTPAQPQPYAKGAARRDPRRGEIPGVRRPPQFS